MRYVTGTRKSSNVLKIYAPCDEWASQALTEGRKCTTSPNRSLFSFDLGSIARFFPWSRISGPGFIVWIPTSAKKSFNGFYASCPSQRIWPNVFSLILRFSSWQVLPTSILYAEQPSDEARKSLESAMVVKEVTIPAFGSRGLGTLHYIIAQKVVISISKIRTAQRFPSSLCCERVSQFRAKVACRFPVPILKALD